MLVFSLYSVLCFIGDPVEEARFELARLQMVKEQLIARGVKDKAVLDAMRSVRRHLFVTKKYRDLAYADHPLPIEEDQTISQPYMVAAMTELLHLKADSRVLEVGTGSGYQAAVLAEISSQVYTIEIVTALAKKAAKVLQKCGYTHVQTREGDGYAGWPDAAPFEAIIVTAAPTHVPPPLLEQLAPGGRMVIPVGPTEGVQELMLYTKDKKGQVSKERVMLVRFVPFTGKHAEQDEP